MKAGLRIIDTTKTVGKVGDFQTRIMPSSHLHSVSFLAP